MDTAELIKRVRRIQINTSHLVHDLLAGNYHSTFRGLGMEFDEVREYRAGDDVRSIDWNVTARTGLPHIKRFSEEREMTVMILVDASHSIAFGSGKKDKQELATELGASLAFAATSNNDKVGLILFTDSVQLYLPPQKGKKHVLRVIREILNFEPSTNKTDVGCALEFLNRVQRRKCTSFLISDFFSDDYTTALNIASRRHDLIALRIADPRESAMPVLGLLRLEDAESGEQILVDTRYGSMLKDFKEKALDFEQSFDKTFAKRGVDHATLTTSLDFIVPIRKLFARRRRKS